MYKLIGKNKNKYLLLDTDDNVINEFFGSK